jgi:hypothetical protein
MAEGDKNTRFFHLRASQRKKRNKICRLKGPDGLISESEQEMAGMTQSFYDTLYISEGVNHMEEVINVVSVKATDQMNEKLIRPFEEKEVKEALFQMFPTKSPVLTVTQHIFSRHIGIYVGRRLLWQS